MKLIMHPIDDLMEDLAKKMKSQWVVHVKDVEGPTEIGVLFGPFATWNEAMAWAGDSDVVFPLFKPRQKDT